ncbi:MAG: sodium:proton antiporter, partial [Lachnospiraceae bacterium]|nr:sodium:proton antiporter [Lachnospiraceae bacterium]
MQYSFASLCGAGLTFRIDGFRLTFAVITTYMWLMTTLFSQEYLAHAGKKRRYYFFLALTYIATMGVFLSNDFFTTFVFFEVMSLASYVCVIHDEKPATMRAGGVYLAVAVIGDLVTLMGLFLLADAAGTLSFDG